MASGQSDVLRLIEEKLSRGLTYHEEYTNLMDYLNGEIETEEILVLKAEANKRLKELEVNIRKECGKWNFINLSKVNNDRIPVTSDRFVHNVVIANNDMPVNNDRIVNNDLIVNNDKIVNNDTVGVNLSKYTDFMSDNAMQCDNANAIENHVPVRLNDDELARNSQLHNMSYDMNSDADFEYDDTSDDTPNEGAGSFLAAKPTACVGEDNVQDDCVIVKEHLKKKVKSKKSINKTSKDGVNKINKNAVKNSNRKSVIPNSNDTKGINKHSFLKNKNVPNNEFEVVGKKRGRKNSSEDNKTPAKKALLPKVTEELKLKNKYSPLNEMETGNAENNAEKELSTSVNKPHKIPPIMLRRIAEYQILLKRINTIQKIKCLAKESGEFVKLFVDTPEEVLKLTKYLEEQQLEFYCVADRTARPVKIVIRGLGKETNTEDIKTELKELKFEVEKVNQLRQFKTKEPLPLFQVHLARTPNVNEIYKVDNLLYHMVTVVKYENKSVRQCFKCQTWQHSADKCHLKPKCVVCAGAHESKNCPNKTATSEEQKLPVKCANCGGQHTASYKGCPKYPKMDGKVKVGGTYADRVRNPIRGTESANPRIVMNQKSSTEANEKKQGNNQTWAGLFGSVPTPPIEGGWKNIIEFIAELGKVLVKIDFPALTEKLKNNGSIVDIIFTIVEKLRGPFPAAT
ncbi:Nucleic-acid-binding protein from transposon X-element [Araneus ventricosus]|uniref:Nucleic-acid-binding protein from transposon X-element n=1 Tax=Araneus ventricosus TaxID=182803 RepID=A0A4Y2GSJ3_ARAVE|nr:Nucleic-acid-binding protein from transposon X-element [Araneus ventricosus]